MSTAPFNVNPAAVAGVTNVLPIPHTCRYCTAKVVLLPNSVIYRKSIGKWPWVYKCTRCDAYVGLHPDTDIPLGTLANRALRAHRSAFKDVFNRLWVKAHSGRWSRTRSYAWLAERMNIPVMECHGAWFDEEQCLRATQHCRVQLARWTPPVQEPHDQAKNQQQGRVPDWYDERNQYLGTHDGRAVQGHPRQASASAPGQRRPVD